MKNTFLILLITFSLACSTPSGDSPGSVTTEEIMFSAKNLTGSTVAFKQNGIIQLGVSKEEILSSFNEYVQKSDLGLRAHSFTIEEIDGKNYIRFYNEDESVSTVELLPKKNTDINSDSPIYEIGSTICTTTECANCCGCIPSGDYCTGCENSVLDCKRTTSSTLPSELPDNS